MNDLNIVDLIEKNPIAKLSSEYNSKLLKQIKETFTGFEQKLFVSSFYCYLNYDKHNDFVVDLDNIWRWLGFQQKNNARLLLDKFFVIDNDYKITNEEPGLIKEQQTNKPEKQNGGHNRQIIMLTIKCFKSLCLKAQTKKAGEIHEYYMKLEEVLHQVVEEETDELRLQLEQKENIITEIKETTEKEKLKLKKENQRAVEQATIAQFPLNTECIYFGTIDNTNAANEHLIKFGHTNDLATRVRDHHKNYENFILVTAFRVQNKVEIENLIKGHPKIKRQIRTIEVNGKQKTEIIAYDNQSFTIDVLTKKIKDIIHSKTYSIDNFNRLLKQNDELLIETALLKQEIESLKEKNTKRAVEMNEMREALEKQKAIIDTVATVAEAEQQSVYQNELITLDEQTQKFNEFITAMCIVRPDVEESSTNMEGQYRIWCKTKPKKETFHALKNYLDIRFKPSRLAVQNKDQVVYGYIGVKLKEIQYKKKYESNITEMFLFNSCVFSPSAKVLNSTLLKEYQVWKKKTDRVSTENDIKELKEYLNSCEYVLKATVWSDGTSNEGYYGLSLLQDEPRTRNFSSTGKTVEKRYKATNEVINRWDTIAKAAEAEKMSAAKMSRSIKNRVEFDDFYYAIAA
jgi:hypothetical protein